MTTATQEPVTSTEVVKAPPQTTLPEPVARRGIDEAQWRTLMNSLFPGARAESVLMVIDYCRARKLDPLKKPCHIVPMKVKDQKTGEWNWRDVVMPGIYEYRTTAMRTGNYLGHSKPEYGDVQESYGVSAPEWCAMTIYRLAANKERIEFPVRVHFREACATKTEKDTTPPKQVANERWAKAPIQMLTKCTEAAGLREAFPDEFGGEPTVDEMDGRTFDIELERQELPAIVMPQRKTDDPAPAPPAADAALTVARVDSQRGASGPYYVVHLSDGRRLSTKDAAVANAADILAMKHTAVRLLTRADADTDPGIEGTAVLVITPPPDTDPQRTPRLDQVR